MLKLDGVEIVQDGFELKADFEVPRGARVAILGPSGAGKSTLLSVISGFLAPQVGRVLFDGRDWGPLPPAARDMSIIFQDSNLFPHLTAAQNVGLALKPALGLTAAQKDQVAQALDAVGLDGLGARRPAQLSGGQQSRIALARMLVQARPLVLLDEAFGALGPGLRNELLALLGGLCDQTDASVMMVTHDPQDARQFASHIIWVNDGLARLLGAVDTVFADPPGDLAAYLGQ